MVHSHKKSPEPAESSSTDAFRDMIAALSDTDDAERQGQIRKNIWDRFGTTGATFISDMANFSSTSRTLGICHFLKLIYRAREIVAPAVGANNGLLLKCDADNCYAFFENANDAIQASLEINASLFQANQEKGVDEHIYLSVGIDYGDLLLISKRDFFGDPVNAASKLGEDLARKGETLVTERALRQSTFNIDENVERMVVRVSDIEISYVRLPMTNAVKGKFA